MVHLTLNSGKAVHNPALFIPPGLEAVLRPFLRDGGGRFPAPKDAYRVETFVTDTEVEFIFFKDEEMICICLGTWSEKKAEQCWSDIMEEYNELAKLCPQIIWALQPPQMPKTLPWLATLALPAYILNVASEKNGDVEFFNACEAIFFMIAHHDWLARS